jgi:hypothetical protein
VRKQNVFQDNATEVGGWKDLEDLRTFARARGCTSAQFSYAVESVGERPSDVAAYINRHSFASLNRRQSRRSLAQKRSEPDPHLRLADAAPMEKRSVEDNNDRASADPLSTNVGERVAAQ